MNEFQRDALVGLSDRGRWRLGACRVDLERHCVMRDGAELRLAPKAVAVLSALIHADQRVVSRVELLDRVWPDADVGEEVLTQSIAELRRALGGTTGDGGLIETIRKSGYRLREPAVAVGLEHRRDPVHEAGSADVGRANASTADERRAPVAVPRSASAGRHRLAFIAAAIIAMIALLTFSLTSLFHRPKIAAGNPGHWSRPLAVTADAGSESAPAVSPDGTRVAHLRSRRVDGRVEVTLELRDVGAAEGLVLLRRDEHGAPRQPAWSPDGTRVAFERLDGERCRIVAIAVATPGVVQELGDCVAVEDYANQIAWRPDGRAIVFARPLDPADRAGQTLLYELDLASGAVTRLPIDAPPGALFHPSWSPDGGRLGFLVGPVDHALLAVVASGGGKARTIGTEAALLRGFDWLPDGRSVVLSSGRELWQVDVDSGERQRLSLPGAIQPAVARRKALLVYAEVASLSSNLQRQSLPPVDGKAMPYARSGDLLFPSTQHSGLPRFSADGRQLAFVSDRTGSEQVWVGDADGAAAKPLTAGSDGTVIDDLAWSARGDALVVASHQRDGRGRVTRWTLADGMGTELANAAAAYSALTRAPEDDAWWLAGGPAPGRVTRLGGAAPRVLELADTAITALADPGDGFLYFARRGDPGLFRRALDAGGAVQRVAGSERADDGASWQIDGERIVLWARMQGGDVLVAIPRGGGAPTVRAGLSGNFGPRVFALAPDGSQAVVISNGAREIDLKRSEFVATR